MAAVKKHPTSFLSFDSFFNQFPAKTFKKRVAVLNAGIVPAEIFYLKKGYARAYAVSPDGEELTMVIFQPGDFFPLISTAEAKRNEYYVESLTEVEIIPVPRVNFLEFLESREDLQSELIMRLTARFEGALTRMEYLVFGNAAQKLASIIVILAERFGVKQSSKITVRAPLTHKDLASLVGITRETTTLILQGFVKQGYISFKNRHLIVNNIKGLQSSSLADSKLLQEA